MFNGPVNDTNFGCSDGISVNDDLYIANQKYGSANISEAAKNFAFAIVFRQLIEVEVDPNNAPAEFNFSSGVNDSYNRVLLDMPRLSITDDVTFNLSYPGALYVLNEVSCFALLGTVSAKPEMMCIYILSLAKRDLPRKYRTDLAIKLTLSADPPIFCA